MITSKQVVLSRFQVDIQSIDDRYVLIGELIRRKQTDLAHRLGARLQAYRQDLEGMCTDGILTC